MKKLAFILLLPAFLFSQFYFHLNIDQKMMGGGFLSVVDSTGLFGINFLFHADKRPAIADILAPVDEPYWWWKETKRYRSIYSLTIITGHFFGDMFVFSEMGLTFGDELIEYKSTASGLYFYLPSNDGPAQWDIDKFSWGIGWGMKIGNFLTGLSFHNFGKFGAFVSIPVPYIRQKNITKN